MLGNYLLLAMKHLLVAFFLSLAATVLTPILGATGSPERLEIAAPTVGSALELDDPLPFNPQVQSGRLDNGLEYFLLEHGEPEDTVVLRLVVDAGSVLETENQLGLAHFLEHMAFNGTERFGETELVAYLEGLGIQFGPDVNAYTSFDETVYKLEIPSDDPETLETGFIVMREWAEAIRFETEAIERERGVIVEEWRTGREANRRMFEQHIPVLLQDSQYAERLPIGDMDIVRTVPREEFIAFYDRWYRPDNMAFIVVGDIPTAEAERLVTRHLGSLRRPETPLHRPHFDLPEQTGLRVSIATDPEATRSTVAIYTPAPVRPFETVGHYRDLLTRALFSSVINERIRDIARDPDSPIERGGIGWSRLLRSSELAVASVVARDQQIEGALERIALELERADRFGVTESELERARSRFFESIEDSFANRDTRPSERLADELVRHWLEGESVPGIPFEHYLYQELLPDITSAELGEIAAEFVEKEGAVVLASIREGDDGVLPNGSPIPTRSDLTSALDRARTAELRPPTDTELPDALMARQPAPGSVIDAESFPEVETVGFLLENGIRVYVKQTDFAEDEVLFSGFSPGGSSLLPDDLVPSATIAAEVALESGIGDIDAATLARMLSGSSASLSASIGSLSERLDGGSREEDLETLFQMIHLALVAPRFEDRALENVLRRTREAIDGAQASPTGLFGRRLQQLYSAGDPRGAPLEIEDLAGITLDSVQRVYRDRFGDPSDFAFFFVGSADEDRIRELAERYLASVPTSGASFRELENASWSETAADNGYSLSPELIAETVRAGAEPVGRVAMILHNDYNWSRIENHRFSSLADLLDIRLRETIREESGGSYIVGAGGWRLRYPREQAFMQIGFAMDPARADELIERAIEVVDELRSQTIGDDYLSRIKAQQREEWEQGITQNSFWLGTLEFYLYHDREFASILSFPELIESLDADDIFRTAQRYLDPNQRIELVLLPEGE